MIIPELRKVTQYLRNIIPLNAVDPKFYTQLEFAFYCVSWTLLVGCYIKYLTYFTQFLYTICKHKLVVGSFRYLATKFKKKIICGLF